MIDRDNLPPAVKQAVAIVETVQGEGAISQEGIEIMIRADNGEISMDDAIKQAVSLFNE